MRKKRKKSSGLIVLIASILVGIGIGILLGIYMLSHTPEGLTTGQELTRLGLMLLFLYASVLLQIVIHEAGHLVFGILSGYSFVSFRIGSIQLTRKDNRFRFSRHSLAGTAGQCLLSPPDLDQGRMPFVLYNLGGSLMNLITGTVFLVLFFSLDPYNIFSTFCMLMAFFGYFFALSNGIPMRPGSVDNDGYNTLSLSKNADAVRAFWVQLKANAEVAKGKRLRDMPDEWFTVPADEAMGNSMVSAVGMLACSRLLDQNRYAEAHQLITHLLSLKSGLPGIYRNLMTCDRMCCEMIGENRKEVISDLYTEELKIFMKSMKNSPSVLRTQYIHALLVEQDAGQSQAILKQFEKAAATYPYPNDVQSDRELITAAQKTAKGEELCHG